MQWLENSGLKRRGTWDERGIHGIHMMNANAGESGITLRHGKHRGRLIVSATFRPHAPEHNYSAMQVARFNLSWIMEGKLTGDGELPLPATI